MLTDPFSPFYCDLGSERNHAQYVPRTYGEANSSPFPTSCIHSVDSN